MGNEIEEIEEEQRKQQQQQQQQQHHHDTNGEDTVLITPVLRFPDKSNDTSEMKIYLSKVYKAEKVELSEKEDEEGDRNITVVEWCNTVVLVPEGGNGTDQKGTKGRRGRRKREKRNRWGRVGRRVL